MDMEDGAVEAVEAALLLLVREMVVLEIINKIACLLSEEMVVVAEFLEQAAGEGEAMREETVQQILDSEEEVEEVEEDPLKVNLQDPEEMEVLGVLE